MDFDLNSKKIWKENLLQELELNQEMEGRPG